MGFDILTKQSPWGSIDNKLKEKILKPHNIGFFTEKDTNNRGVRLVIGESENKIFKVKIFWLVDLEDGIIVDAKFQAFGSPELSYALEIISDLIIGKGYVNVKNISPEAIDSKILDLIKKAALQALSKCLDIPISINSKISEETVCLSDSTEWEKLSVQERIALIEKVLDEDVRPLIALDGGGLEVVDLKDDELIITYNGACATCYSAVGSTLSFIQQTLQKKVYAELQVIPEIEGFFDSE